MDKPSYRSVYSTAAILAAFSRASGSEDELLCATAPKAALVGPSAFDACASVMRRWKTVLPRSPSHALCRRHCHDGHVAISGTPGSSPCCGGAALSREHPQRCDQARRLVTSHFAFSDRREADPERN